MWVKLHGVWKIKAHKRVETHGKLSISDDLNSQLPSNLSLGCYEEIVSDGYICLVFKNGFEQQLRHFSVFVFPNLAFGVITKGNTQILISSVLSGSTTRKQQINNFKMFWKEERIENE